MSASRSQQPDPLSSNATLNRYRSAVSELVDEADMASGPDDADRPATEKVLDAGLPAPELQGVLSRVPGGIDAAADRLVQHVYDYRPNPASSANSLAALIRIYLLSQIDAAWWGDTPAFDTAHDVLSSDDLVDLDPLRTRRLLGFRYRRQPRGLPGRARDWGMRRTWPGRQPHTSGLLFTRARPESVVLLNQLARDFASQAPPDTPALWVTSLVRSVQHQHRLRALGYVAVIPSAHCAGYAMDVEMRWFRRFDADGVLAAALLDRQDAGDVNVIDEGQAWHVCVSPTACDPLRRDYATAFGG
ncbi:MAG TPA: DUF5715 family protein [Acidimicrobiales bacterium]|nr:DUF5715 family protein [Acidimicrobiales bacterium]